MREVEEAQNRRPSRAEIESLCILEAVGPDGCTSTQLAERLGLSPALADAVAEAAADLEASGWLSLEEERICRTDEGQAHLQARLQALGVA